MASYFAPVGRYSLTNSYFVNNEVVSWPLRGLAEGMSGVNGVYRFGANAFPSNSFASSNYWVDVVFMPTGSPPDPDPPSPPPAPTGVSAAAASSMAIDISWSDVATETGYRVERSPNGTSGWTSVGTTAQDVTSFQDTGLSASTTYFYRVVATNAAGNSEPSSVVSATTLVVGDTTPPTAPARLKATGAKSKVNLSWSASTDSGGSGLAGYEVWRATNAAGPFVRIAAVSSSTTSHSDTAVLSSLTYWYYVVAVDGADNVSPPSDAVSARPK